LQELPLCHRTWSSATTESRLIPEKRTRGPESWKFVDWKSGIMF